MGYPFYNVKINESSVTATTPPTANGTNPSIGFSFQLDLPGDFYEFTVEVKNAGTIDAMIDSITKTPTLTTSQEKYLNYIIEYENGEQITSKQLVKAGEFVRLKVRVEYRTDLNPEDLPTVTETLNLGFSINYVQADNTGFPVENNGVDLYRATADGWIEDIGVTVTIGNQEFYTIGLVENNSNNVKLLSKMNITLEDNPIQSSNVSYTIFSNTSTQYSGSIVEGYVNNYKQMLERVYDINILEARLITYQELTDPNTLGCSLFGSCSSETPWVLSLDYWSGTAYDSKFLYGVSSRSFQDTFRNSSDSLGVRPVIVISRDVIDNDYV